MAELIKINIEVNSSEEKLLSIPQRIEVPQFSVVQWNISDYGDYLYESNQRRRSLIFTLYFEDKSPFSWKRKFIQLYHPYFILYYSTIIRLAEDVVDVKGDFKYGVSVFDADQNSQVYDDDPYLKVY
jgi:hypothetical protein